MKIYNPETGEWEKVSSTLASTTKVVDADGHFNGENVEECLSEIAKNIGTMKKDIKYIYQNGTLGGGTGPGGGAMPKINIIGDTTRIVKSNEKVTIHYNFTSPNPGIGKVYLAVGDKMEERTLNMGARDTWVVGPFESGEYTLSIYAEDKQGFPSETAVIKVISGAIDLSTTFSDLEDFNMRDPIIIPYTIKSKLPYPMMAELTFNGKTEVKEAKVGDSNVWNIGPLPYTGVHKASIKIHAGQEHDGSYTESNQLDFTLVAADGTNLLVSTTFNKPTWQAGKRLQLDYRISMIGQLKFKSYLWIKRKDEVWAEEHKKRSAEPYKGTSFWDLGTDLPLGAYTIRTEVHTYDGKQKAYVDVEVEIVKTDFEGLQEVSDGLIIKLDSNGKQGDDVLNRNKWENSVQGGPKVNCTLHNFNHKTNGWIVDPTLDDQTVLSFSGKTYAELDYKPLENGVERGLTIDILYKVKNTGNMDAKVIFCKNLNTPYQGFYIDTEKAEVFGSGGYKVSSYHQDDIWTRKTFVIDRVNKLLSEYTNGAISDAIVLPKRYESLDEFKYEGKLILGSGLNIEGNYVDNATCSIKTIRVYDRALTHMEILQNHIADIKDNEKQKEMYELNSMDIAENTSEINPSKLPVLRINGYGIEEMGENSKVQVQIDYSDPLDSSRRFIKDGCMIELQGTSSLSYPVKNYTLYLQEGITPKYAPKAEWLPEERWTLKTNYMDSSNANNTGLNKFIYSIMPLYPPQKENPKTRGNTDGFPMKVYINGRDYGTYTWNIDRYAHHNYGFISYDAEGMVVPDTNIISYEVAQNSTGGPASFASDDWERVKVEFKSRYHKGWPKDRYLTDVTDENGNITQVLTAGQHEELLDVIKWVKNADDNTFVADVEKHFSLEHLINYYLIVFAFGMIDSFGKNMVLTSYGRNEEGHLIWYPSFYDCDTALGLANNGEVKYGPEIDLAPLDDEVTSDTDLSFNTQDSRLWKLLRKNFSSQINARYNELRRKRLSQSGATLPPLFSRENLMNYLGKEIIDLVGQRFTNQDAYIKYINPASLSVDMSQASSWMISCNGTREQYTRRWIDERFIYLDSLFEYESYSLKKITLRTYVKGDVSLYLRTYSPQKIKIKYSSNEFVKVYCNKDKDYEVRFNVTNATENDFIIYGADNVMLVKGMEYLQLSHASFEGADKIIEINTSGSRHIRGLEIGSNCKYLQKVICTKCANLGEGTSVLDLSHSETLRYVDISNTKIQGVKFPENGGILDEFKCSNSNLQSIALKGQEYLQNVDFTGCRDLASVSLESCNGLTNINLPESNVSTFRVTGCTNIERINLYNSKKIDVLELNDCPNLKHLNLQNVIARNLTDLDLRYCPNIEELNVGYTNSIKCITFSDAKEILPLKQFLCSTSGIETIRYGLSSKQDYLDLGRFNLDNLSFLDCKKIKAIKNIDTTTRSGANMFRGCSELVSVEGRMTVIGSMAGAFYGCPKLEILPNELNLTDVTSISETFRGTAISTETMARVMGLLSDKLTNCYAAFGWCTKITGKTISGVQYALPPTLFDTTPSITSTDSMFRGAKIQGRLHPDLLNNLTALSGAGWMFAETAITGDIPENFLKGPGAALSHIGRMFYGTQLTSVPRENIFKHNPNITSLTYTFASSKQMTGDLPNGILYGLNKLNDVSGMFEHCSNMGGCITNKLFDYMNNGGASILRNISYCLRGTKVTGTIPVRTSDGKIGLFDKLPNLTNADAFFPQEKKDSNGFITAHGITGAIPERLFANNPKLTSISSLFNGCGGLTGSIPEKFFEGKSILNLSHVFAGCYGLTGSIPAKLFDYNPTVTNISGIFSGCSGLEGEIPRTLFHRCLALSNATSAFQGCSRLVGAIPDRVVEVIEQPNAEGGEEGETRTIEQIVQYGLLEKCTLLKHADNIFSGCSNLTSKVPEYLFADLKQLQSISYAFSGCINLFGDIPSKLLSGCIELRNVDGLFQDCRNIGRNEQDITVEHPYAIPPDFFSSCMNLTTAQSVFYMPYGANKMHGEIPRELFFNNLNLQYVDSIFRGSNISGDLDGVVFGRNLNLKSCSSAFRGTKLESVGNILSGNTSVKSILNMFASCGRLTGNAPKLWEVSSITDSRGCFAECPNLDNYSQIPASCKIIPSGT